MRRWFLLAGLVSLLAALAAGCGGTQGGGPGDDTTGDTTNDTPGDGAPVTTGPDANGRYTAVLAMGQSEASARGTETVSFAGYDITLESAAGGWDPANLTLTGPVSVKNNNAPGGKTMYHTEVRVSSLSESQPYPDPVFDFSVTLSWYDGSKTGHVPSPGASAAVLNGYKANDEDWNYVTTGDSGKVPSIAPSQTSDAVSWVFTCPGWKAAWTRIGSNMEIYVGYANGLGTPINVSHDTASSFYASLSADGTKVAWEFDAPDGNWEIYVGNADGSGIPVNVSRSSSTRDEEPSLSANGTTVAWTRNVGNDLNPNYEVYVGSTDGSAPVNVSNNAGYDLWPSLSDDGTTVAWYSERAGGNGIYVGNANGSGTPKNVSNDTHGAVPSLSGDGTKVAWVGSVGSGRQVYVGNANGSDTPKNVADLGTEFGRQFRPSLSADGTKVSWEAGGAQSCDVYVGNANGDGLGTFNVSNHSLSSWGGRLSPDGTKVVWSSESDHIFAIYVGNADGSGTPINLSNASSHWPSIQGN